MQYFGVPICPYCKKRVNLIRTWSLKKQGEYRCPRCGGISNIFLSPLIYVVALMAVFAGGAVYFFHKFVLDDVTLSTAVQVMIPFVIFFLISLFMVYLAKPVIKKVSKAELERKKRGRGNFEDRRPAASGAAGQTGRVFYDAEEYMPKMDYRTGPVPSAVETDEDMKIVSPVSRNTVVATPVLSRTPARPAASQPPARPVQPVRAAPVQIPSVAPSQPKSAMQDDFFAKYDDPAYIERRLQELKDGRNKNS